MSKNLIGQIATRRVSIDFHAAGMNLPNPDPVLKALGLDIKVYRELRSDAHVGGCVRRRKAAVKALEWGVDREKAKNRHAQAIEDIFSDLDISRIISEALDAVLYGYQPMEVVWEKVGNLLVPVDVIGKPANWFVFDENNQLRMRTKHSPVTGEELPPMKFLLPRQDATYDNPYGFPDLSMCFWPTTFKKGGLKFWVAFTEKYGNPWVIGKHPRAANDKETNDLLDSLEQMVQDAVAAIPDDASIEIISAADKTGSAEVFERLLRFCRSEVSIALLGQNQTTEAEANRASAVAGLEVGRDIRDGDSAIIIDMFNQLIRWTCELNFGDIDRPIFDLWEPEEIDKLQAERDEILTRAGARFSREYFARSYGLQEGDLLESAPDPEPDQAGAAFAEKDAGQDAVDRLIEEESAHWQPLIDPLIAPLEAAFAEAAAKGETAGDFIDRLPALLGQMDTDALQDALTRFCFAARLAGRAGVELE
ncbi:MAG: DUF935 domain-containing protein [Proteobacteria bacterium]|nr:DUF935 domain-containing protein [Pseudomonadota bacterium]